MKNQLIYIRNHEIDAIIDKYANRNCFIAQINGKNIHTFDEYTEAVVIAIKLPNEPVEWLINIGNFDSYYDWMTDFGWLEQYDEYVLIISDFDEMMDQDERYKKLVLENFNNILYYWEKEINEVLAEGEDKGFMIYLANQ